LHSNNKKEIKHPNTTKTNACPTGQHTLVLFQRSLVVQILERATFFAIKVYLQDLLCFINKKKMPPI
jgi:hypothetical protein